MPVILMGEGNHTGWFFMVDAADGPVIQVYRQTGADGRPNYTAVVTTTNADGVTEQHTGRLISFGNGENGQPHYNIDSLAVGMAVGNNTLQTLESVASNHINNGTVIDGPPPPAVN